MFNFMIVGYPDFWLNIILVCLWGCYWKRFELVDWVKAGWTLVKIIQSTGILNRTKNMEVGKNSLVSAWLLSWDTGLPGPELGTYTQSAPVLRHLDLGWNCPGMDTDFPGTLAYRWQTLRLLRSVILWTVGSHNTSLYMYHIGSISLSCL